MGPLTLLVGGILKLLAVGTPNILMDGIPTYWCGGTSNILIRLPKNAFLLHSVIHFYHKYK